MCPNKKLQYFEEHSDWRPDDVREVRRLVEARWRESYAKDNSTSAQDMNLPDPQASSVVNVSCLRA